MHQMLTCCLPQVHKWLETVFVPGCREVAEKSFVPGEVIKPRHTRPKSSGHHRRSVAEQQEEEAVGAGRALRKLLLDQAVRMAEGGAGAADGNLDQAAGVGGQVSGSLQDSRSSSKGSLGSEELQRLRQLLAQAGADAASEAAETAGSQGSKQGTGASLDGLAWWQQPHDPLRSLGEEPWQPGGPWLAHSSRHSEQEQQEGAHTRERMLADAFAKDPRPDKDQVSTGEGWGGFPYWHSIAWGSVRCLGGSFFLLWIACVGQRTAQPSIPFAPMRAFPVPCPPLLTWCTQRGNSSLLPMPIITHLIPSHLMPSRWAGPPHRDQRHLH